MKTATIHEQAEDLGRAARSAAGENGRVNTVPCYDKKLMILVRQVTTRQCPDVVNSWLRGRYDNEPGSHLSDDNRAGWRDWHRKNAHHPPDED